MKNYIDVQNKVYELVREVYEETHHKKFTEPLTNSTRFTKDFCFDSLDLCETVLHIEKEFNYTVPSEIMTTTVFRTVGDLVDFVYDPKSFYQSHKLYYVPNTNQKTHEKPIQLVKQNNTSIQFHRDNKVLPLTDPAVSPILERIRQELENTK